MASEQTSFTTDEMKDNNDGLQVEQRRTTEAAPETPVVAETDHPATFSAQAEATVHPGWIKLPEEELPQATYWPVVMALAITLVVFGVVTTVIISIVGLFLFLISLIGWIGDMKNESHGKHEE